eukprot:CAMPEP_0119316936 /NCGR_PEP_ID=MMETSP1333-20130426/41422_1 /TAXON_ID=418940 /ORGANISM="Scyphosphaera apsteinii, Strain RCC1455" /LENGTH=266 /DNA_ID=CAMNT_0007322719 /DNA_START=213 /DNA_END=1013 /DNA_ORIENTATION=-
MRRLGVNVWPLHTVQFSNHTQYGAWEGLPTPNEQISALVRGIEARGVLGSCDAVLSGYLGSAEQAEHITYVVDRVRRANPKALYLCDPVMGHPEKGCVVPEGVQAHHAECSAAIADVMCPNVLELGIMTGHSPANVTEVVQAARSLLGNSTRLKHVLVKHLAHAGLRPTQDFEMVLVGACEAWHIATPLLPFSRPPVGVGDLTSAIFLARLLFADSPSRALEHTASAYHAVMQATLEAKEYELQLVRAQDHLVTPPRWFAAQPLAA